MHALGMADSSLVHFVRKEYVLNCNWKVFADNYLDGGYHVSACTGIDVFQRQSWQLQQQLYCLHGACQCTCCVPEI
jgi:hypothetical protein